MSACVGADLQFHAFRIAEEERPLTAEALDLADLGPRRHEALAHLLERAERIDGQTEVIDGAPATLAAPLADDVLRGHLEDVEGGTAAEVEDHHAGMVGAGLHLKRHTRVEGVLVEA